MDKSEFTALLRNWNDGSMAVLVPCHSYDPQGITPRLAEDRRHQHLTGES